MSNPSQPNGPPGPPDEGPTKTFVLKIDGWLSDLMKKDLESDADPPAASPTPPEGALPEAAPPPRAPDPEPAPTPPKR